MIKCDKYGFKYYNEDGEHEIIDVPTNAKAAEIINDLLMCNDFKYDSTILSALYIAMRKLQNFSDEDIKKLIER